MYFLSIVPVSSKTVAVDGKMTRLIGYFSNSCQNVTALFLFVNYLDLEPILKNLSKSLFCFVFFLYRKARLYRYQYTVKIGENTRVLMSPTAKK